jgi:transcriptional regulator with XRE-family HTH domain
MLYGGDFVNRIKQLREELRMTQVRLSTELGVSQETVSAYEVEKHFPSAQQLMNLSTLFRASIDFILGTSDVRLPVQAECLPEDETKFLVLYRSMTTNQKDKATAYIRGMLEH